MTSTEKGELSFGELSLEPIVEDEALKISATPQPSKFHANTRSKTRVDRRVVADRRQVIRFEPDRRAGKDRRPKSSWEPGKNL